VSRDFMVKLSEDSVLTCPLTHLYYSQYTHTHSLTHSLTLLSILEQWRGQLHGGKGWHCLILTEAAGTGGPLEHFR
jgi:hypothetical protein